MITVKFLGPTNTKGSRYKATLRDGTSVTIPNDYALGDMDNRLAALKTLLLKLDPKASGDRRFAYAWVRRDADAVVFIPADESTVTVTL